MVDFREKQGSVTLQVRVQPRASKSGISGEQDGALKLRIAAPPVDGKANEECRRFLAKLFGVPATTVEVLSGESSRLKLIRIRNLDIARARQIVAEQVQSVK